MADGTKIEWTDATWNPITGCAVISPGCQRCYAMRLAGTRMKHHPSRAGLTRDTKAGPVWTGEVRFNEQWLLQPLQWKRPRTIFVCAHADLFHENVPDEWIDRIFAVMALAPQHIFQVLTKRAERMREYFAGIQNGDKRLIGEGWRDALIEGAAQAEYARTHPGEDPSMWLAVHMPLPNVWLGVSVEDQTRADERVPHLRETPAALRWISAEPLLGPLDLKPGLWLRPPGKHGEYSHIPSIDWVVAGGESGPGARPMHPDWARSIRDQCADADVPFHFKQHGAYLDIEHLGDRWNSMSHAQRCDQQFVQGKAMIHVGKKAAGRLLDGVEHNGVPAV